MSQTAQPTFLWIKAAENEEATYEITGRRAAAEPRLEERGEYATLIERDHIPPGSRAVSFRDDDLTWVSPEALRKRAAVEYFDRTQATRARVVTDTRYGAAFGMSVTAIDGRPYAVVSGYAVIAHLLVTRGIDATRGGIVLLRGVRVSGHVSTTVTVAVPVLESKGFGRARAFHSTRADDVIAHLADSEVGLASRQALLTLQFDEILDAVRAVPPYPAESEFLGRPLGGWLSLGAGATAAFAALGGVAAGSLMWFGAGEREQAARLNGDAAQLQQQARADYDRALVVVAQSRSIDAGRLLDVAASVWRPLTVVLVRADQQKAVLTVRAPKALSVTGGEAISNPLLSDADQLGSLLAPRVEGGLAVTRVQTSQDLNETEFDATVASPLVRYRAAGR